MEDCGLPKHNIKVGTIQNEGDDLDYNVKRLEI
jgi:hypothetical protein